MSVQSKLRRLFSLASLVCITALLVVACGGGGSDHVANAVQDAPAQPSVVASTGYVVKPSTFLEANLELVAGTNTARGIVDDREDFATFSDPVGIVRSGDGSFYVADKRTIRRISPDGNVTTIAGLPDADGWADGDGAQVQFDALGGIAIDSKGNLFVTETEFNTVRKITPAGRVTTIAGTPQVRGHADGVGPAASFTQPTGIAVDGAGNVYLHEATPGSPAAHRLRKVTPDGHVTTIVPNDSTFALSGNGVAVDGQGRLYVMGSVGSETVQYVAHVSNFGSPDFQYRTVTAPPLRLLRLTPEGAVEALAPVPDMNFAYGTGGMSVDAAGNVYIASTSRSEVLKYSAQDKTMAVLAGAPGEEFFIESVNMGPMCVDPYFTDPAGNHLCHPKGVTVDPEGMVYTAESVIRRIDPAGDIAIFAGMPKRYGLKDGPVFQASFAVIGGMAALPDGVIYVSDANTMRRIANGQVTTIAPAAGLPPFESAGRMASDTDGNVYMLSRNAIWKLPPDGSIAPIAIKGTLGTSNTGISPRDIAVDRSGNLYVALGGAIRKITPDGSVTTLAGNPSYPDGLLWSGMASDTAVTDGPPTVATFRAIGGITADGSGSLYVVDTNLIRKIDPFGNVSTLAQFRDPSSYLSQEATFGRQAIVADAAGNLYVADIVNNELKMVTSSGTVSSIAKGQTLGAYVSSGGVLQSLAWYDSRTLLVGLPGGIFKFGLPQP